MRGIGRVRSEVERALLRVPLFSDLRRVELGRLARLVQTRTYASGDLVIREGDPARDVFVLLDGEAEVQRGGTTRRVATLRAGDFFGEMSLFDSFPRSASVRASTPCRCLVLSRWDFLREVRLHPALAVQMLPVLSRRLRALEDILLP
jgi:CRP/FNR family cyclic AMP-dependent transcriptional regulator